VSIGTVKRGDHHVGVENADAHASSLGALFGTQAIKVTGLIKTVEHAQGVGEVGRGAVDDDAIGTVCLDDNLIAGPEPGCIEALYRKGDLVLGGDARHTFTLA